MDDAGWNQVQDECAFADIDGVPRIMPALITRDDVEAFGQQIDDLAFALIAPLRADNDDNFRHKMW